ncbi:MAG: DUF480 domain-containing protein [Actinomycetales bacterium]
MTIPELDPVSQRVVGALLEKERTVPASYPLSLNALRTACNQASSRDPVTDYDDDTVTACLRLLKEQELVRFVWAGKGSRAIKYHQTLTEHLALDDAERAVLTVLLLRGAQAPGELKTRTDRLHSFGDRQDVEVCLAGLAGRGLVRELEKIGGQHDRRWLHLLGPVPSVEVAQAAAEPGVDREAVLARGAADRDARVRQAWDAGAGEYAEQFADELDYLPLERMLLDEVAELVGSAPVLDVGCGPGHIAGYLAEAGVDVTGIDLSPAMIEQATTRHPEVTFEVGDQANLLRPPRAHSWGAILSLYSTIHLAGSELAPLLAGFARVLDDDGRLLLAVRTGNSVEHRDTFAGQSVDVDVVFHDAEQVLEAVQAAGFVDVQWYRRGPVAEETDEERLFVTARRP